MERLFLKWIPVLLLPAFMLGCSSGKKLATQKQPVTPVVAQEEEQFTLDEQKQMEFDYLFLEALKEKSLGNPQRAIQILSECLQADPNSSAALYELAAIQAENNDLTSATLLLEKAISLNPENKWYKLLLADILQQTRKYNQAAQIYNELLSKDPENLEYLFMKAALLASAGKVDEAIDAYNALEEKTGINEQISVSKQQLYIQDKQIDKAFEEINKLINFDPDEPKYYGLMADLYQNQGDPENALKYYKKIQEIDPDNGFVHFSLANFYFINNNPEKAFEETKEGFRSEDVDLQTKLQMYMLLTADPAQSELKPEQEDTLIDILLEVHPEEYMVHTVRAESFLKRKKPEEARAELLKALSIEKNDYILWERLLFVDNDLQDWQGLYKHSLDALELFPNQPQLYFLNAIACIQLKSYEETISITDEGLMYVADNKQLEGQFLMLKGEALYKIGQIEKAFELFDKSIELDPENHITLNNYAYYLSLAGKDLNKAERMSGQVIERFPENATYLDTYAWVLFKKGEYKLAKFYMESALKNSESESSTLLEHYGDILFKLGNTDDALEYWNKALDLGEEVSEVLKQKINQRKYIEE